MPRPFGLDGFYRLGSDFDLGLVFVDVGFDFGFGFDFDLDSGGYISVLAGFVVVGFGCGC